MFFAKRCPPNDLVREARIVPAAPHAPHYFEADYQRSHIRGVGERHGEQ
jgi:hypothetical protein